MAHDGIVTIGIFADDSQYTRTMRSLAESSGRTVNRAISAHVQPLGRITGEANEFQKSLAASNARVIAFGASTGAIFAVRAAFKQMVHSTIEVEKELTEMNAIFQLSGERLRGYANQLFDVANAYGTAFSEATKASLEFARQGNTVEETLKRTAATMALARISGLDVGQAVASLTSILNTFHKESLDAMDVVNRMTAIDTNFAISAGTMADALSRVSSAASDANVSLNETMALVAATRQLTARSGTVIGNSWKTIFTRLQRPEVLSDLESVGVKARDAMGKIKPMTDILRELSSTYDTLASSQKSFVAETVGGVYQINTLKAIMRDLGSGMSIVDGAMRAASNSTDYVNKRMAILNETISSQLVRAGNHLTQTFAQIGTALLGGTMRSGLNSFERLVTVVGNWSSPQQASEGDMVDKFKANLGIGALRGAGNFLRGPAAQFLMFTLIKLYQRLEKFLVDSARELAGVNQAEKQREATNESVAGWLRVQKDRLVELMQGQTTLNRLTAEYVDEMKDAASFAKTVANVSSAIGGRAVGALNFQTPSPKAGGFVPNLEVAEARRGGYQAGNVVNMTLDNGMERFGVTANTNETITRVIHEGKSYDFVNPPVGSPAANAHRAESLRRTGLDPYTLPNRRIYGHGFVPNLALSAEMVRTIEGLGINTEQDVLRGRDPKHFTSLPEDLVSSFVGRYREDKPSLAFALRSLVTRNTRGGIPSNPTDMYDWLRGWMMGTMAKNQGYFSDMKHVNAVRVFAESLAGGQVVQSQDIQQRAAKLLSLRPSDIQKVLDRHGPSFPFITAYDDPETFLRQASDRPGYVGQLIHTSDSGKTTYNIPMPIFGHHQGPAIMQKWQAIEAHMREQAREFADIQEPFQAHEMGTARGAFFEKILRAIAKKEGVGVGDIGSELDIYGAAQSIISQTNLGSRKVAGMEVKASASEAMSRAAAEKIFKTLAGSPEGNVRGPVAKYIPKLVNIADFDAKKGKIGIIDADKFGEGDKSTAHYQSLIYAAVASGKPLRVHYGPMTTGKTTAAEKLTAKFGGDYVSDISQIDSDQFSQFVINKTDLKNLDSGVFGLALGAASQVRAFYHPYATYQQRREQMIERLKQRNRGQEGKNAEAIAYKYDEPTWQQYGENIENLGRKLGSRVRLYDENNPMAARGFVPNLMIDVDDDRDYYSRLDRYHLEQEFGYGPRHEPEKEKLRLGAGSSVEFDKDSGVLDIGGIYRGDKDANPWMILRKFLKQRGKKVSEIAAGTIVGPKIPKVLQSLIQMTHSGRAFQELKGAELTFGFSPSILRDEAVDQVRSGQINKNDFKQMVAAMKFLGVKDFKTMRPHDFAFTLAQGFVPNLAWPTFPEYTMGEIGDVPVRKSSMGVSDSYFNRMIHMHMAKITAFARNNDEDAIAKYLLGKYGDEYGKKTLTTVLRHKEANELDQLATPKKTVWNNLKGFLGERFMHKKLAESELFSHVEKWNESKKADFGLQFLTGQTGRMEVKNTPKIGRYTELGAKFSEDEENWLVGNDDTTTAFGFVPNFAVDLSGMPSLIQKLGRPMSYVSARKKGVPRGTELGEGAYSTFYALRQLRGMTVGKKLFNDREDNDMLSIAREFEMSKELSKMDMPDIFYFPKVVGKLPRALAKRQIGKEVVSGRSIGDIARALLPEGADYGEKGNQVGRAWGLVKSFQEYAHQELLERGVVSEDFREHPQNTILNSNAESLLLKMSKNPSSWRKLMDRMGSGNDTNFPLVGQIAASLAKKGARMSLIDPGEFTWAMGRPLAHGFIPNLALDPQMLRQLIGNRAGLSWETESMMAQVVRAAARGLAAPYIGENTTVEDELEMARRYAAQTGGQGSDNYWVRRVMELTRGGTRRGAIHQVSQALRRISEERPGVTRDMRRVLRAIGLELGPQFAQQGEEGNAYDFVRQATAPHIQQLFPPADVFRRMLTESSDIPQTTTLEELAEGKKKLRIARNSSDLTIKPSGLLYIDYLRRNSYMHIPTGQVFEEANPLKTILGYINKGVITGISASVIGPKIPNIVKQVVEMAKGGKFKSPFNVSVNWTPYELAQKVSRMKALYTRAKEESDQFKQSGRAPSMGQGDFRDITGFMNDEDEAKLHEAFKFFGHNEEASSFSYNEEFGRGFIPNLYSFVSDALNRENRATGGRAALGMDARLRTDFNPLGLAAYDTSSQRDVGAAVNQHMALGQNITQVRRAHTGRGYVPNLAVTDEIPHPTVDTGGFYGSSGIVNSLMLALLSSKGAGGGSSEKRDTAIVSGKFRMFYSDMDRAAASLRMLDRTMMKAQESLARGEAATVGLGEGAPVTFEPGEHAQENLERYIKNNVKLPQLKQAMEPHLKAQEDERNKLHRIGMSGSILTSFGGGMLSQIAQSYGGDKGASLSAAIDEFSAGATTASQILLAFPTKFGRVGALSIAVGAATSAADIWSKGLANARRTYEASTTRFQMMTSQIDTTLQALNQYDQMLLDASVGYEAILREEKKYKETLASIRQMPGGEKIAANVEGQATNRGRMNALAQARYVQENQQNLRSSAFALQEYASARTFGFGLSRKVGVNPFGYGNEAQHTEVTGLMRSAASSAIANMSETLKSNLAVSSSPQDFMDKLDAAAKSGLPELAESAKEVIEAFSGIREKIGTQGVNQINLEILKQLFAEKVSTTPENQREYAAVRERNAARQIQIENASNLVRSRTGLFVNAGAMQTGFKIDQRFFQSLNKLNEQLIYGTPNPQNPRGPRLENSVSARQAMLPLLRMQYGEGTTRAFESATEMQRVNAETTFKVAQIGQNASRNVFGSLTRSFESLIKAPEQQREAYLTGAGLPTAPDYTVKIMDAINKGISTVSASGDVTQFRNQQTGQIDMEKMFKAITTASGAQPNTQFSTNIMRYLQAVGGTKENSEAILNANKEILQATIDGNNDLEKIRQTNEDTRREISFKEMSSYLGGIKNVLDRSSRRGLERNLSRGVFMMEHGRNAESRAMGGAMFLQTMKEMNIPIDLSGKTPLSKLMKKAWDIGTQGTAQLQGQMMGRVLGTTGRLNSPEAMAGMQDLMGRGGAATAQAIFRGAFQPENQDILKPNNDYMTASQKGLSDSLTTVSNNFNSFVGSLDSGEQDMLDAMRDYATAQKELTAAMIKDQQEVNKKIQAAIDKQNAAVAKAGGQVAGGKDSFAARTAMGFKDVAVPIATLAVGLLISRFGGRGGAGNKELVKDIAAVFGKEVPAVVKQPSLLSKAFTKGKDFVAKDVERVSNFAESLKPSNRAAARATKEAELFKGYEAAKKEGPEALNEFLSHNKLPKATRNADLDIVPVGRARSKLNEELFGPNPKKSAISKAMQESQALGPEVVSATGGGSMHLPASQVSEPAQKVLAKLKKQGVVLAENQIESVENMLGKFGEKAGSAKNISKVVTDILGTKTGTGVLEGSQAVTKAMRGGGSGKKMLAVGAGLLAFDALSSQAAPGNFIETQNEQGETVGYGAQDLAQAAVMGGMNASILKGGGGKNVLSKGISLAIADQISGKIGDAIGGTAGKWVGTGGSVASNAALMGFGAQTGMKGVMALRGGAGAAISIGAEYLRNRYANKWLGGERNGQLAGFGVGLAGAVGGGMMFGGPLGGAIGGGLYLGSELLQKGMEVYALNKEAFGGQKITDLNSKGVIATAMEGKNLTTDNMGQRLQETINRLTGRSKELTNRKEQDTEDSKGFYGTIASMFTRKQYTEASKTEQDKISRQLEVLNKAKESGSAEKMLEALKLIHDDIVKEVTAPEAPEAEAGEVKPINSEIKVDISVADSGNITSEMSDKVVKPLIDLITNMQVQINDLVNQRSPRPALMPAR